MSSKRKNKNKASAAVSRDSDAPSESEILPSASAATADMPDNSDTTAAVSDAPAAIRPAVDVALVPASTLPSDAPVAAAAASAASDSSASASITLPAEPTPTSGNHHHHRNSTTTEDDDDDDSSHNAVRARNGSGAGSNERVAGARKDSIPLLPASPPRPSNNGHSANNAVNASAGATNIASVNAAGLAALSINTSASSAATTANSTMNATATASASASSSVYKGGFIAPPRALVAVLDSAKSIPRRSPALQLATLTPRGLTFAPDPTTTTNNNANAAAQASCHPGIALAHLIGADLSQYPAANGNSTSPTGSNSDCARTCEDDDSGRGGLTLADRAVRCPIPLAAFTNPAVLYSVSTATTANTAAPATAASTAAATATAGTSTCIAPEISALLGVGDVSTSQSQTKWVALTLHVYAPSNASLAPPPMPVSHHSNNNRVSAGPSALSMNPAAVAAVVTETSPLASTGASSTAAAANITDGNSGALPKSNSNTSYGTTDASGAYVAHSSEQSAPLEGESEDDIALALLNHGETRFRDRKHRPIVLLFQDTALAFLYLHSLRSLLHWHKAPLDNASLSTSQRATFVPGLLPRRHLLFVNPAGGSGRALTILASVQPLLRHSSHLFSVHVTTSAGDAEHRVADPQRTPLRAFDVIAAVSGDGLLSEIVNGVMARPDWEEFLGTVTFAHVPAGSGNGLAASVAHRSREAIGPLPAAFLLCKGAARAVDLFTVQQPQEPMRCGFLSVSWGMVSDADFESEQWRCCGGARFTVSALARILCLRKYEAVVQFLPANDVTTNDGIVTLVPAHPDEAVEGGLTSIVEGGLTLDAGAESGLVSPKPAHATAVKYGPSKRGHNKDARGESVSMSLSRYNSSGKDAGATGKAANGSRLVPISGRRQMSDDNDDDDGEDANGRHYQQQQQQQQLASQLQSEAEHNLTQAQQRNKMLLSSERNALARFLASTKKFTSAQQLLTTTTNANGAASSHTAADASVVADTSLFSGITNIYNSFFVSNSTANSSSSLSTPAKPDVSASSEHWVSMHENDFTLLWGMNVSHAASDIHAGPYTDLGDGYLDLMFTRDVSCCSLLSLMLSMEDGTHLDTNAADHSNNNNNNHNNNGNNAAGVRPGPGIASASAAVGRGGMGSIAGSSPDDGVVRGHSQDIQSLKVKALRLDPTLAYRECVVALDGERLPMKPLEVRVWRKVLNVICM